MTRDKEREDQLRARQKGRALVMALALGALVILLFAISIAKMTVNR